MAKETITRITDDLDGSENAEEISFAYNGVEYSIDLAKKNKAAFEKALKPYIDAGSKSTSRSARSSTARSSTARSSAARSSRRGTSKSSSGRRDLAEIRSWAKDQGLKVSDRGRVSSEVIAAYDAR